MELPLESSSELIDYDDSKAHDPLLYSDGHLMNRAIDRFKTGCVQIGFIKTYWLKERRKISQDLS